MKKIIILGLLVLLLVGCNSENNENNLQSSNDPSLTEESSEASVFTYESENGPIDLPADPERIVVLDSSAAGAILLFDGDVVGHEPWTGKNELFKPFLENSTEVSVDDMEQILALEPDLIVVSSFNENIDRLKQIAPTVSFTYGRLNYLDTILAYGQLVNKEEQAREWIQEFTQESQRVGILMKEKYGQDVTISVMEAYGEEMYLYGDNWGRGTQVVYQAMGLSMPENVKRDALETGYYSISAEVLADYAADLMIMTEFEGSNTGFLQTDTWNNIPAVQENLVLRVPAESFYMTGPITLNHQLQTIERFFLNQ